MEFISNQGVSEDEYVKRIIDPLIEYPELIIQVSRMFTDYNTNRPDIEEIEDHVINLFQAPKVKTPPEVNDRMATSIRNIYTLSDHRFNGIKSKVLETIIYRFGPFTAGLERKHVFIEPTIKDGGLLVGETDNKCDIVFFDRKEKPVEFIECKSNISSVITQTLPFQHAQERVQKQITYLHNVYLYFEESYCRPYIYFACYNMHVKTEQKNLQEHWGYQHISILTPEDLLRMYLDRINAR